MAAQRPLEPAGLSALGGIRGGCSDRRPRAHSLARRRLLSERVSNTSSVRLMEHAATLDLEDFEDAEFQDQLERARRQTSGRMALMAQLFSQAHDLVTAPSL